MANKDKHGARCDALGSIYLHVVQRDNDGNPTWTDYGIRLAEAIYIRDQLDTAISSAANVIVNRKLGG